MTDSNSNSLINLMIKATPSQMITEIRESKEAIELKY
jgi:hypothetical protein